MTDKTDKAAAALRGIGKNKEADFYAKWMPRMVSAMRAEMAAASEPTAGQQARQTAKEEAGKLLDMVNHEIKQGGARSDRKSVV